MLASASATVSWLLTSLPPPPRRTAGNATSRPEGLRFDAEPLTARLPSSPTWELFHEQEVRRWGQGVQGHLLTLITSSTPTRWPAHAPARRCPRKKPAAWLPNLPPAPGPPCGPSSLPTSTLQGVATARGRPGDKESFYAFIAYLDLFGDNSITNVLTSLVGNVFALAFATCWKTSASRWRSSRVLRPAERHPGRARPDEQVRPLRCCTSSRSSA